MTPTEVFGGMELLLSGAALAAVVVVVAGFNPWMRWKLRRIPGPRPRWLTGNFLDMRETGLHRQRDLWQKQHGKVFVWWRGPSPMVIVADPDAARKILLKHNDKKISVGLQSSAVAGLIFKHILPTLGWDSARTIRAAWQPVFHSSSLASYAEPMNKGAARLMARLERAEAEGKEINMWRLLGDMTMDVVGETAFGVDLATQADTNTEGSGDDPSKSFTAAAQKIFQGGPAAAARNPLLLLAFSMPWMLPVFRILAKVLRLLDMLPKQMKETETAVNTLAGKALSLTRASAGGAPGGDHPAVGSFLSRLAAASKSTLDDYQVAAQAFTFMLAGYETTANTLAFCMYNLARSPEALRKAQAEVDALGEGREVQLKDLDACPYLEAIVQESLRMYPPVTATIPRYIDEPLEVCGYKIPAGTDVAVNSHYMHHDPELFRDPEQFRPERFLKGDPQHEEHHPYAHLPFGGGARICIGMKFALEEIKLALVAILRRYEFELSPGQVPLRLGQGATQGPADGIFGRIRNRATGR